MVSFFDSPSGTATPNDLGSLGGVVLTRRRFRSFGGGVTTALGWGDDCINVPGAETGESMPGINT